VGVSITQAIGKRRWVEEEQKGWYYRLRIVEDFKSLQNQIPIPKPITLNGGWQILNIRQE
jgi:hypothetical protein